MKGLYQNKFYITYKQLLARSSNSRNMFISFIYNIFWLGLFIFYDSFIINIDNNRKVI